ncbi:heterokaryon incompatibility protein-domain-containing protein [Suillus ampliporus]|nr:heterokaryon incompatibility protein-domain-containing protein [Suillus ampliporus]
MTGENAKDSDLEWSTGGCFGVIDSNINTYSGRLAFKKSCTACCVTKGDGAAAAGNYEEAIELYSAGIMLDSSCESLFTRRSKANLEGNFYVKALHDAERVIELNPSSRLGYELKHAALHGAHRYNEAIEVFKTMLLKSDDVPDAQRQKLRQRYVSPSEAEDAIIRAIDAQLENAPFRFLNTSTGLLCDRGAQINAFMKSMEYKELLSSSMTCAPLQTEAIKEAVAKYFSWAMLSHRWQSNELLLHNIQGKVVYDLAAVGTTVKLQTFCKIARDAGHRWAWSDTCCIDQKNNVELQASVNSMFVWYRHSALTIVYLSDVSPSSEPGALANSVWNTRGWTVQEFLAPNVILFYRNDWTLYLDDRSSNHKKSDTIMEELQKSTGIDRQALVAFCPGTLVITKWASTRATTLQEDIAYSLFGIFGIHLPVIYGEMKQNALGRLLQAIVAQSGDITALDWVGKSSQFNSCLPAEIHSYKFPTCMSPSLSEDQIQTSVSSLRNSAVVEQALTLYTRLDHLSPPRFADRRLQLPCITFPITEVKRKHSQHRETGLTYELIRPWNRYDLELPDLADETQSMYGSEPESPSDEPLEGEDEPVDLESHLRELRLVVRLGQPFGALLLAQQRGGEYKRIASDHNIIAHVKDMASVANMMDVRTLEIL